MSKNNGGSPEEVILKPILLGDKKVMAFDPTTAILYNGKQLVHPKKDEIYEIFEVNEKGAKVKLLPWSKDAIQPEVCEWCYALMSPDYYLEVSDEVQIFEPIMCDYCMGLAFQDDEFLAEQHKLRNAEDNDDNDQQTLPLH